MNIIIQFSHTHTQLYVYSCRPLPGTTLHAYLPSPHPSHVQWHPLSFQSKIPSMTCDNSYPCNYIPQWLPQSRHLGNRRADKYHSFCPQHPFHPSYIVRMSHLTQELNLTPHTHVHTHYHVSHNIYPWYTSLNTAVLSCIPPVTDLPLDHTPLGPLTAFDLFAVALHDRSAITNCGNTPRYWPPKVSEHTYVVRILSCDTRSNTVIVMLSCIPTIPQPYQCSMLKLCPTLLSSQRSLSTKTTISQIQCVDRMQLNRNVKNVILLVAVTMCMWQHCPWPQMLMSCLYTNTCKLKWQVKYNMQHYTVTPGLLLQLIT